MTDPLVKWLSFLCVFLAWCASGCVMQQSLKNNRAVGEAPFWSWTEDALNESKVPMEPNGPVRFGGAESKTDRPEPGKVYSSFCSFGIVSGLTDQKLIAKVVERVSAKAAGRLPHRACLLFYKDHDEKELIRRVDFQPNVLGEVDTGQGGGALSPRIRSNQ